MPKINGNEIRIGNVLEHNGGLWSAVKVDHVKPGKGGAFNQVEMKNLKNNSKLNERFRASEQVERARVEEEQFQYLYKQEDKLVFMNLTSYEQIELNEEFVADKAKMLRENEEVTLELYDEVPIGLQLPKTMIFTVKETEAVVKGQTAASSNKPAIVDNDLRVMVPPFIDQGEEIVINTEDMTYLKRNDK